MKKILITGMAGFLGFHVAKFLSQTNLYEIFGVDSLLDDGDREIKLKRLEMLGIDFKDEQNKNMSNFQTVSFKKLNLNDISSLKSFINENKFDYIIHFASKAGVSYSFENPYIYFRNNINGLLNLLELLKNTEIENLLIASSASVYGLNNPPFKEEMKCNPISPYGVSALSMENLAKVYSLKYNIPIKVLRIFTVIGEYGRKDMGVYKIINKIKNDEEVELYNFGENVRDMIDISDFSEIVFRLLNITNKRFDIYNIASGNSIKMKDFVELVEKILNKCAKINLINKIEGDIEIAKADISKLKQETKKNNFIPLENTLKRILKAGG